MRALRGSTLFEMIVTIVLLGIVATALGAYILPAVRAHQGQLQRAALVDEGEAALRRMARDVRISLPNSLRITNTASGFALEMVPTADGGRYCFTSVSTNCAGPVQLLDFAAADTDFDILGCFRNPSFTGTTANYRLVIGDASGQIYSSGASPAVATPSGATITVSVVNGGGAGVGACGAASGAATSFRHHIAIAGGHRFSNQSTRQRLFVIQNAALPDATYAAPVSYICDATPGVNTLRRYAGYAINAAQPTTGGAIVGGTNTLVVNNVSACSLATLAADVQSTGLLTLTVSIRRVNETVQLMSQIQLDNTQ